MQQPVSRSSRVNRTTRFLTVGCTIVTSLMFVAMSTSSTGAEQEAAQPANSASVELNLDVSAAVVLDKEVNGMPAGTRLISTRSFYEYSLAPVVDGIKKRKELGWQECSWASEDNEAAHGIEIQFGKPQQGGRFQVTWAYDIHNADNGKWWISRNYVIQVKEKAADAWKTVITVKNNQSAVGSYPLPKEAIGYLRIYQLPLGGHMDRPNIMWIGQVELAE